MRKFLSGAPVPGPKITGSERSERWLPSEVAEEVSAYAEAGVDVLIVFPQIPSLEQVEQLAEHVLPAYLGSPLPA